MNRKQWSTILLCIFCFCFLLITGVHLVKEESSGVLEPQKQSAVKQNKTQQSNYKSLPTYKESKTKQKQKVSLEITEADVDLSKIPNEKEVKITVASYLSSSDMQEYKEKTKYTITEYAQKNIQKENFNVTEEGIQVFYNYKDLKTSDYWLVVDVSGDFYEVNYVNGIFNECKRIKSSGNIEK